MYSCKDLNQLLLDYLEDRVPDDVRKEIDYHLSLCDNCQVFIKTYKKTMDVTGKLKVTKMPPQLEEALLKVLTRRSQ